VTGRASVWSDPRVIELSHQFVSCTDEVWRLQRGTDPECVVFQEMANHGHYGGQEGGTRQGVYVCAPQGGFLDSLNSNDADKVLVMMKASLEKWRQLPIAEQQFFDEAPVKPQHRWEASYPEDGLVLNVFTRDLPASGNHADIPASRWNQDRTWFSAAEAKGWIPSDLMVGSKQNLPTPLLHRLVKRHLVDTVNGQTTSFQKNEISPDTKIIVSIEGLDADSVKISFRGNTYAQSNRVSDSTSVHGVWTKVLGHAVFNRNQSKFTEFKLVAVGKRWGKTTFNGRRQSPTKSDLGFVVELAGPNEPRIPPAFVSSYEADWILRPQGLLDPLFDPDTAFRSADINLHGKLSQTELDSLNQFAKIEFDFSQDGFVTSAEFEIGIRRYVQKQKANNKRR
jgi:hypothetical protein